jgi:periplasmic divalent cation tolerance protein
MVAVPNRAVAKRLSLALLEARLCACAQTVGPITSRYTWQGRSETTREWLLLVKTRPTLFAAVEAAVRALHPYEVPEIAAMTLHPVHSPYVQWIYASTRTPGKARRRATPAAKPRSDRRHPRT